MASDITSGGGINIQTGGEVNIKNITLEKGTHSVFCAVILTSPFMLPKITFAWLVIFAPSMLRFF
jgi:hypothetical protein